MATEVPDDLTSAVGIRHFRYFLYFRFALTFSSQMMGVIVGWQVYAITGSPLTLGLIGLAEVVPYVGTSLFGGHVADLIDRRNISLLCAALFTSCGVMLLCITEVADPAWPHVEYLFYGVIFLTGIIRGFMVPAVFALFAQIVPRRLYLNASAWNTNLWHLAAVAGPAAGGMVYGFWGIIPAYVGVVLVASSSLIAMWRIPAFQIELSGEKEPMVQAIAKGVRFVFSNQIIFGALALDLVAVLFGGAVAMLPVFASDVLHTGPEGLGYLRAAPFLGSVLMGVYLAYRSPMRRAGWAMLWCVGAFGACMVLFAVSTNFLLSFTLLLLSGVFDSVSVVVRATVLQLMTPDNMRGRVSAVNNIFVGTSNELGAFESGLAARLLGLVPSVVIGGAISIATVIAAGITAPKLRKLDIQELLDAGKE